MDKETCFCIIHPSFVPCRPQINLGIDVVEMLFCCVISACTSLQSDKWRPKKFFTNAFEESKEYLQKNIERTKTNFPKNNSRNISKNHNGLSSRIL